MEVNKKGEKMKKVTVEIKIKALLSVNENTDIADVINELDYELNDTTTEADIIDTEIVDFEIIDSR